MMDIRQVGKCWEGNARTWTDLSRKGYDVYRDLFNAPAFQKLLGSVEGLGGLDIGCGEGHNTRLTAQRGASMTGVDIAPTFIAAATTTERNEPLGIRYLTASAAALLSQGASKPATNGRLKTGQFFC